MTQERLPLADPIVDTTIEFHLGKGRHFRRGLVKRVVAEGVYDVVEITESRRGPLFGRRFTVSSDMIKAAS